MGHMRGNRYRGAWLVAAWLAFAPAAYGQGPGYAPAHPQLPFPLGSTRPENGGFWVTAGYNMLRFNNPLKEQPIAVRGFQVFDPSLVSVVAPRVDVEIERTIAVFPNGQITVLNIPELIDQNIRVSQSFPGQFFGSGREALNVNQLTGDDNYNPGFNISMGWMFDDGSSLSLNWKYFTEAQHRAGATLAPANAAVGDDLADSFLFSPVFNFPPEYSGPPNKIVVGGGGPQPSQQVAFGIWNGASIQTIEFRQRFQQWDIMYREPIYETDDYRLSGLVGPRLAWFWERFKWRTTSIGTDIDGNIIDTGPDNVGVYTNITSNRMYGVFTGCEQEFYMGHGFACHLKTELTLFMNSVKERAQYETENRFAGRPENKRAKREWTAVPGFNAAAGLMWYPTEFVQIYAGYEFISFLNTLASRRPVDFDYSNLNPKWSSFTRCLDGFSINLAIRF
jgi:hypothetical protein